MKSRITFNKTKWVYNGDWFDSMYGDQSKESQLDLGEPPGEYLDLEKTDAKYSVKWYNPPNGGGLQDDLLQPQMCLSENILEKHITIRRLGIT